jgi:hypothetical protein
MRTTFERLLRDASARRSRRSASAELSHTATDAIDVAFRKV